jgi:integrase
LVTYKDPIAFLYLSGWRSGEVKKVERRDVDRPARVIRLRPELAKNKKGRVLPLTGELLEIVDRALANARPDCPLLFHTKGRPLGDIRKTWKKACIDAGLCGVVPHDFRRSAVRNLTRAGIPEKVAMSLTGHKTRSVFDRYNIVSEEDLAQAADQLESYLHQRPALSRVQPMRTAVNSTENSDTFRTQDSTVDPAVISKSLKILEPATSRPTD